MELQIDTASCSCSEKTREYSWIWSDCETKGHEGGCYVVWCVKCDVWSSDCDDPWKPMPKEWVS